MIFRLSELTPISSRDLILSSHRSPQNSWRHALRGRAWGWRFFKPLPPSTASNDAGYGSRRLPRSSPARAVRTSRSIPDGYHDAHKSSPNAQESMLSVIVDDFRRYITRREFTGQCIFTVPQFPHSPFPADNTTLTGTGRMPRRRPDVRILP